MAFAAVNASAQIAINPPVTTTQYLGQPNVQGVVNPATGPLGAIVLRGSAISAFTGLPVRHLWVADANFGICRVDPELDAPGPYSMTVNTCPFKINGASITGGPMDFDPLPPLPLNPARPHEGTLYFVDEQRASQGIMRIGWDPDGDGGHGELDFNSIFIMGGNPTGARFGGGFTGCALPGNPGLPDALALSPLGDVWVGFKKSGAIFRFNSPRTASATGFGTCDQFIQQVATVNTTTAGLAFIGHDLWGADKTSPFVVKNADTTCLVPPAGACAATNTLAAVAGVIAMGGDQVYPNLNGNNLYFTALATPAAPGLIYWAGNASSFNAVTGAAAITLDSSYMTTATITPNLLASGFPDAGRINGIGVDSTDPANVVTYGSDDYSLAVVPGEGRWFQTCQGTPPPAAAFGPWPATPYPVTCQTPVATAVPGAPLNVIAIAGNASATVSWAAAQIAQPITSYTVTAISAGPVPAPITVLPTPGVTAFPPTTVVFPGLTNGQAYTFTVIANNILGPSAPSAPSNSVTPSATPPVPNAPGTPIITAIAGDTQANVTFSVSVPLLNSPVITSYKVAVCDNLGNFLSIPVTIPPPAAGIATANALIGGLTNGIPVSFCAQAVNSAGNSASSPTSNAVTPSAANIPVLHTTVTGPTAIATGTVLPINVTYTITVTNPAVGAQAFPFPASNVNITQTLTPSPATIAAAGVPGALRDGAGKVTITTTTSHGLNIGQSVIIAGVTDATFNGTFVITDTPTPTSFTFAQAGPLATSGSGTATLLPLANVQAASASQGTCTAGGAGVISVTCSVGTIPAGTSVTMNVIVQIQNQALLNSIVTTGTDFAATVLANSTASISTTVPLLPVSNLTAPISISGNAQVPNPNVGQSGNIVWTMSDTSATQAAPNVVFTNVIPAGQTINSYVVTVNNGGAGACAGPAPGSNGGTIICTTPSLGGSTKGGAKPPQTMIVTVNITNNVGNVKNQVFPVTGTVTFGPGGTDTLPNSVTVKITSR
ncbi:MAG: fibronectin type III domain-containing protein [Acidobacteriia bacterium]|nr:fibronectin type III domain-containing protein [Terriglobia bacterium]